MSQLPKNIGKGEGGNGLAKLEEFLKGNVDDLNMLRDELQALLQKLDNDSGTANDYESSLAPSELKSKK
ncbi:hypothetical protein MUN89_15690 [Halobacillus salinarum]|uniref:Uncharacterized protein n=1 Tax=Halobacillus salinarum TaxID=2932257 RepID=A0ABY4EHI7_9BACI|nr:hypothetical protein [Halobacillus salinarum]UOQ43353.1 hypothetical protein MUN89_15690 [Halobacillus salinarum]